MVVGSYKMACKTCARPVTCHILSHGKWRAQQAMQYSPSKRSPCPFLSGSPLSEIAATSGRRVARSRCAVCDVHVCVCLHVFGAARGAVAQGEVVRVLVRDYDEKRTAFNQVRLLSPSVC